MAVRDILIYPDSRLRERANEVKEISSEVRLLLDDMTETMYAAPGIGLAAPQVGVLLRAIVIDLGVDEEIGRQPRLYKIINPEIVSSSGELEYEEGCLSIPDLRDKVIRSANVHVRGLDENGSTIDVDADGLFAVCLQHEIDHLDGVLFVDRLSKLRRELMKSKLAKLAKLSLGGL